jgi:hypothetical protein
MSDSRPAFVTERKRPSPWDGCGLASGAMAADYTTGGRCTASEAQMRAACGIPDRPGISDPTTAAAVHRALVTLCPGISAEIVRLDWSAFMARLRVGYGAVLNGMCGKLPAHYRRWDDYTGPHSVFVMGDGTGLWWMDPLAPAGWEGEHIISASARAFAEAFANPVQAILVPPPIAQEGTEPMISAGGLTITSSHVLPIKAGARIHSRPGSDESFSAKAAIRPPYIGKAAGWNAVLINTGNVYLDKVARPTVLYVQGGTPEEVTHV